MEIQKKAIDEQELTIQMQRANLDEYKKQLDSQKKQNKWYKYATGALAAIVIGFAIEGK